MSEWWTYTLSDFLLFSPRTYYRLFELHNAAWWPVHFVAVAGGVAIVVLARRGGAVAARAAAATLALAWAWVAWAFLWQRYGTINWAAAGLEHQAPGIELRARLDEQPGPGQGGDLTLPRRRLGEHPAQPEEGRASHLPHLGGEVEVLELESPPVAPVEVEAEEVQLQVGPVALRQRPTHGVLEQLIAQPAVEGDGQGGHDRSAQEPGVARGSAPITGLAPP